MSLLAAVEQALLRRHAPPPPPTHSPAPGVDASNASSSRRKPKSAVQELEELRKAPGSSPSQQLQSLRGHFESCITQPSRYVEEQQLSRWMQGTRCTHREYSTHGQLLAKWSKELESDIRSVVTEAGLSVSATSAVVDASKRGAIADNPGVLLCQIMALQSALDPHVGKRAVGSILRVMPSLLNTSSDTVSWHYEELATMLGPSTAASLAVKAPFILSMAPFMVWSKLTLLQRLLGISIESAQAIVVRQPRLLCMAQVALEARLRELQSMARLGDKALRQLVVKQPALLSYTPATLASNLAAMGRALGTSDEQTSKMLARMPTLIMLSPSTVTAKLSAIQTLLTCSPEQAALLVTRQPFVLSVSSALLAQKHEQVGLVLHTSPQDTSQVLRTNPTLLTLSTTTLAHKLTLLRESVLAAQGAEQQVHAAQGSRQQLDRNASGEEQGQQQQRRQQQQPQLHNPILTSATPSAHGNHIAQFHTNVLIQDAAQVAAPLYNNTHTLKPTPLTSTRSSTSPTTAPAEVPFSHLCKHITTGAEFHHTLDTSNTTTAPAKPPPPCTSTTTGAVAHDAVTASSTTNSNMATSALAEPPLTSTTAGTDAHYTVTTSSTTNPSMASLWLSQLEALTPQQRAALACFSKDRFERLPQLAAARAGVHARLRNQHDQGQLQQQQVFAQSAALLTRTYPCSASTDASAAQSAAQSATHSAALPPGATACPASAKATGKSGRGMQSSASKGPARKGPASKGVAKVSAVADRMYSLAAVLRMAEGKYRDALAQEQGCEP